MTKISMKNTVWYSTKFQNNTLFVNVLLPNGKKMKLAWTCKEFYRFDDISDRLREVLSVPEKYEINRKVQTVSGDGSVYWWVE